MMGGGSVGARLASVMGTDDNLAEPVGEPVTLFVCDSCGSMKAAPIIEFAGMEPQKC